MSWETLLYIAVIGIIATLFFDIWAPKEGFMVGAGSNPFITGYFPRRGDISFQEDESGYIQDPRHVRGYADVQALSVNHDFCRLLIPKGGEEEKDAFFACALAGTENLSSTSYRTLTTAKGFRTSRDDYMRDADKDGRTDYCAILKMTGGKGWQPRCYRALQSSFDTKTFLDDKPPKDIADILYFYEGIIFWFRFIDDMKDYGENLRVYTSGDLKMNEAEVKTLPSQLLSGDDARTSTADERVQITRGLQFNGTNQFLRLGDSPDMGFGRKITLTTMRALCFWVYFDEFTNNAHILDFGNGAGDYNVFVGIIGKGDQSIDTGDELRPSGCIGDSDKVLPDAPSGAQPVEEVSPINLMLTSSANVDEYACTGQEVLPRILPPIKNLYKRKSGEIPGTATLLYEIWNGKQRLEHIVLQKAFKRRVWTHVCITTATGDGVRPAVQVWINGQNMAENPSGYLPQSSFTTNNYLGKSNWDREGSKFENKPELFKGSLFDLRAYNQGVTPDKLKKTISWGKKYLGLDD